MEENTNNQGGDYTMDGKPRLLDRVREQIRVRHYSVRAEKGYVDWIKRFILFHIKTHPVELGKAAVESFLSHLAINRNVYASTQNQALGTILFPYRDVPGTPLAEVVALNPQKHERLR